jgi:signal transduction histidine kinase/DNA-binding response OmpR family regulator
VNGLPHPHHPLLERQLKRLGLTVESLPAPLAALLDVVDRTYRTADQDRYLLERSLSISSEEMQSLYEALRAASESRVAAERDKLRAVLASLGAGVAQLDAAGRLVSMNPEGERILGCGTGALAGRSFLSWALRGAGPGDGDPGVPPGCPIESVRVEDSRFRRWEGSAVDVSYAITPLEAPSDGVAAVLVFFDLTERRRMEQAVREAKEVAEAASRAKSEFLANISHEIRTPLNAVIGMTSLLLGSDLTTEHRDHVQTIRKSGEALLALINEILDFSRLEAGRMPLEEHPFLLRERVGIAFELVAPDARRKGLLLRWEVGPGCPAVLVGDAARLQQVLLNLLCNAVKFTAAGEVLLTVDLAARESDNALLRFRVCDTGVGLPPDRIEELFSPFLQADASTSRRYGGSGLGLAISRRLVERMGGEITAESTPGGGSIFTFTVLLRCGSEADLTSAALLSPEAAAAPEVDPHPLRLLLAEDNPLNQKVARLLLEKLGYSADLVANGLEVLAALERQDYDVVLMDIMMPELDGLEATRRIVARWPRERRPRIVALTASAMREDRERCLEAGMDEYLSKPIDLKALAEALQRAGRGGQRAPRGPEAPSLPMIDELWRLDPQETVRLLESFLVHLDLQLDSLRVAVEEGNAMTIERVAHSLRGASATLGLQRLPDSLGDLIRIVKRGDAHRAGAILIAVDQDADRERELLRNLLASRVVER